MKKRFSTPFILAILSLAVTTSCSKSETADIENTDETAFIKTLSIDWGSEGGTESYSFTYTNELLTKVDMMRQYSESSYTDRYALSYNTGNELESFTVTSGTSSNYNGKLYISANQVAIVAQGDSTSYELNAADKPVTSYSYRNVPANTPAYDLPNYLVYHETFSYASNNLHTASWTEYEAETELEPVSYSYTHGDNESKLQISPSVSLFLINQFGYFFKLGLLSANNTLTSTEDSRELTYLYLFDDEGRPESIQEVESNGTVSASITVTYY